jgi:hypothetical protein
MRRWLDNYANDQTRGSGLIAETAVTLSKRLFIVFRKRNIALSVPINVSVLKTVRCAWISHVPPMNA